MKGIVNTSNITIRIRRNNKKDIELPAFDYKSTSSYNCVIQEILVSLTKGKQEIELLDDKLNRIIIESFIVR